MSYNPEKHRRRSIRLKGYDYSAAGAYFITVCAHQRECLFGEVRENESHLNAFGRIVEQTWHDLPNHNSHIELDAFVVMPNHIHGIIFIREKEATETPATRRVGLPEIIRQLKTFSAKRINALRGTAGAPVWQRNYYERIIRNEQSLQRIRQYILDNPLNWESDEENPSFSLQGKFE